MTKKDKKSPVEGTEMTSEKVDDLKESPYNPRKITDEKLDALGRSMRKFGDLSGVIKNVRTGNLIGGHQRLKNFDPSWPIVKKDSLDEVGTIAVGYIESPFGKWFYREVDWDDETEKAANIAANKHGGEFDTLKLQNVFESISLDAALLSGFSKIEITDLLDESSMLEYQEKEIQPYVMTHVLISFPPEKMILIKKHLEKIIEIQGVEYEQSSNG